MTRRIAALLLCLCLGLPVLASAETPTWEEHPSKNKPRKHVMVQFTDATLHPSIAQVVEGGTVSWVNYASLYDGSIVFSQAVAAAFTCSDLRPNWIKTGAGYQSIPVTMGGGMDDLELPCPLKPGEYQYEIWLFSGPGSDLEAMGAPQSRMQGKIIVR
jgi:hypothetical protein